MTATDAQQQADATATQVLGLLAAYNAGQIDGPDFQRAAATATFAGKIVASRLADIEISTRADRPPIGIQPGPQHLERLEQSAATCLEEPESAAERLSRLAEAEVLASHRLTLHAAIREQGFSGWREAVAEDACPICLPFADRLHDTEDGFRPHHPRCRCSLVPVGQAAPVAVVQEPAPRPRITLSKQIRSVA